MAMWVTRCLIKHSRGHPRNWLTASLGEKEQEWHSERENMRCRRTGMTPGIRGETLTVLAEWSQQRQPRRYCLQNSEMSNIFLEMQENLHLDALKST